MGQRWGVWSRGGVEVGGVGAEVGCVEQGRGRGG